MPGFPGYAMKALALLVFSSLLAAAAGAGAQVAVREPWVRATVAHQNSTGAFMRLQSPGDTRLVEARSPVARTVEIHEMSMENNVMKMRAVDGVDLPAGKPVELKPGGYHMMLIGLTVQIREGDSVPITLVFEGRDRKRQVIDISARAAPLNTVQGMKH